jgi:hypothetical protein
VLTRLLGAEIEDIRREAEMFELIAPKQPHLEVVRDDA